MADLDKIEKALRAADAAAKNGVPGAEADARALASEYKRLKSQGGERVMSQFNAGVGDVVDFLNPFDKPHALNPFPEGTGSAADAMNKIGIPASTQDPQGIGQNFMRGAGQAAGGLVPVTKAAQGLSKVPGVIGGIADDAYNAMASRLGMGAEVAAGGVAGAGSEFAKEAGAGPLVQAAAGMVAPLSIPAASAATRGLFKAAGAMPVGNYVKRMGEDVASAIFPMSDAGARNVARKRVLDISGGNQDEYAKRIDPQSPLTPAQQIGEPEFFGLETSLRMENPAARKRLDDRFSRLEQDTKKYLDDLAAGDVGDAQSFFDARLKSFKKSMEERVATANQMADESLDATGPRQSAMGASQSTAERLKEALDVELETERSLWGQIPKEVKVDPAQTKSAIARVYDETPWAQRRDIPIDLENAVGANGAIGETPTVKELHGLYSEMRRIARAAMAGNDQNKNRARIANQVAEAILEDLDATTGVGNVSEKLAEARAFSRALHETFDRGAVGAVLKRTIDGDTTMNPAVALDRTVGRGGPGGSASLDEMIKAAPAVAGDADDYLRGKFLDSVISPSGDFTPAKGKAWIRQNRETLANMPDMRDDLTRAMRSKEAAIALKARSEARIKAAEKGPGAKFAETSSHKAALSIIGARDPVKTARSLVATARKDETGKALGGLKAALADNLISSAMMKDGALSGANLRQALRDDRLSGALKEVLSPDEFARLETIARHMAKAEMAKGAPSIGPVLDTPANTLLDTLIRMKAAQVGGEVGAGGGMGGSLQTANIFSTKARNALHNLTNRKAREILSAAIEDPALMKALMTDATVEMSAQTRSKIAPYIVGGVAGGGLLETISED